MQCPKCDATIAQRDAVECPGCGVVLAKASAGISHHPYERRFRPAPAAPPRPAKSTITLNKLLIAVAVVVVAGWLVRNHGASVAAGEWYDGASGFDRALSEQRTSSQTVLLYFHTDWCGYCQALERDVFNTSRFSRRYGSAIKVRVNPEKSSRDAAIAREYAIRGYPTVFVITASGDRQPIVGYGGSDGFYERLDAAMP